MIHLYVCRIGRALHLRGGRGFGSRVGFLLLTTATAKHQNTC
jgi:hypothetical protein